MCERTTQRTGQKKEKKKKTENGRVICSTKDAMTQIFTNTFILVFRSGDDFRFSALANSVL